MPLTIEATHKKWIKASEEWTQESRKGEDETHFDRNFSIDDMTWRRLGNLKFNVKLHTFDYDDCGYSCGPFLIIESCKFTGFSFTCCLF